MTDLEVALLGFVVVLLIFVSVLLYVVSYFRRQALTYRQNWQTRQSDAYAMETRQVMGDMSQVLGTFSMLGNYEQIILLSTTSSQASMDLLGVNADSLDFIEIKKRGAGLHTPEKKIKRLVDEGKVRYIIKDVELPDSVQVTDRKTRNRT